jgi:hypothetical protein
MVTPFLQGALNRPPVFLNLDKLFGFLTVKWSNHMKMVRPKRAATVLKAARLQGMET